jgi:site-specific recombinase XerD
MSLDLAHAWEQALATAGVTASSRRRYLGVLRDFLAWYGQHQGEAFSPARLEPRDLLAYTAHRQAQGHRPSTLRVSSCALRSFVGWLLDTGQHAEDVALRFSTASSPAPLALRALTAPDVFTVVGEAFQGRYAVRDEAVILLMLATGLSFAACLELRLGDLSWSQEEGHHAVRTAGAFTALPPWAGDALIAYLAERWSTVATHEVVRAAWQREHAEALLWNSQKGGLRKRSLSRIWETLLVVCVERGMVPASTTSQTLRELLAAILQQDTWRLNVRSEGVRDTRDAEQKSAGPPGRSAAGQLWEIPLVEQFLPLLQAIAAVAQGEREPRGWVESELARLEQHGFCLTAAVQAVWAGQRDSDVLTRGLDEIDAALIRRVLVLLEPPEGPGEIVP